MAATQCSQETKCKFNFDEKPSSNLNTCTHQEKDRNSYVKVQGCKSYNDFLMCKSAGCEFFFDEAPSG